MIDAQQVLHVARLARLELAPDQVEQMTTELQSVLGHIEQISSLDLDGVEPMAHAIHVDASLRADESEPPLEREVALSQAPSRTKTGFLVPSPQA